MRKRILIVSVVLCSAVLATGEGALVGQTSKGGRPEKPSGVVYVAHYPDTVFHVSLRRKEDVQLKGDIRQVDLYVFGPEYDPVTHRRQIHLDVTTIIRCTSDPALSIGTLVAHEEWMSDQDKRVRFSIDTTNRTIVVEAPGTIPETWQFKYESTGGTTFRLTDAGAIASGYSYVAKRLVSEEWVALRGTKSAIPWNCPLEVSPIYDPGH